jgi:hypothetical protein
MKKPLLIRMGTAYNPMNHDSNKVPHFNQNFTTCNPCFAINSEMAKLYLASLKQIYHTSDVYFHVDLPKYFGNKIQAFTMFPFPIYELSFVKSIQKFESLIRPTNQLRRLEYRDFLFLTPNPILSNILKKICGLNHLDISENISSYHGNINSFLLLNETDQKKYFFQNIFLITDDKENDIQFIQKQIQSNLFKKWELKINHHFENNIEFNNSIESATLFYDYFMKLCLEKKPIEMNISRFFENQILSTFFMNPLSKKHIDDYPKFLNYIKNITKPLLNSQISNDSNDSNESNQTDETNDSNESNQTDETNESNETNDLKDHNKEINQIINKTI